MKFSVYNNIIIIEGRHTVLYNSLSDRFVVIRNLILYLSSMTTDEIYSDYPDLFKQLISAGFIVENGVDEIGTLIDRI